MCGEWCPPSWDSGTQGLAPAPARTWTHGHAVAAHHPGAGHLHGERWLALGNKDVTQHPGQLGQPLKPLQPLLLLWTPCHMCQLLLHLLGPDLHWAWGVVSGQLAPLPPSLDPKHSPVPTGPGTPPLGEQVEWPGGWLAVLGWRTGGCWAQLYAGPSHLRPPPSGAGQTGELRRSLSWPSQRRPLTPHLHGPPAHEALYVQPKFTPGCQRPVLGTPG